ncbi:MAG: hypothetical protein U1F11_08340 [Steroidobacteraceae bacterium]
MIIDEPRAGLYYGGDVAAPVFSSVVGGALRLLAVAPDAPLGSPGEEMPSMSACQAGAGCGRAACRPRPP